LLRPLYRAISYRSYDQLSALKPVFGFALALWRRKEIRARQHLHDLPPMVGWCLADKSQILPLIAAISLACAIQHESAESSDAVWHLLRLK
jgi:hypothetical protein